MPNNTPAVCSICAKNRLPDGKINQCADVVDVIKKRPDLTYAQIAEAFGLHLRTVKKYAKRAGIKRHRKKEVM